MSRLLALPLALFLLALSASAVWAAELIVDNTDPTVQLKGSWTTTAATAGFYGADYAFRTAGDGSAIATYPFPASGAAGKYELFARWSSGPNRATNATYQVLHAGGTASVVVSQKVNGGSWQPLGSFDFQPGKGHGVSLSDKADGVVIADAIRWVGPSGVEAASAPVAVATAVATAGAVAPQPTGTAVPATTPSVAATSVPTPADTRFFPQTRYRIDNDAFWDFFQKRGGVRTFGYPVSNTFVLFGSKVQIFQRLVMQQRPDGGVQTMNVLDDGIMPYTKINGSTFPAPDPAVTGKAPKPDDPDYLEKVESFIREMAPDELDGQPVNFAQTFFNTVKREDAFPGGVPEGLEGLLPGFNLEIWGLPTSKPMYEPTNRGFIYQRFQRGVMHYDASCRCTQGLLLADYLKAIATGKNLPPDLAAQAKGSRFFAQWAFSQPLGLARPNELPGSNWKDAFRRDPFVTVDAGHGGREIGTSRTFPDGTTLQEKHLNLRVATRVKELLQQAGYDVTMTRTTDSAVNADGKDLTGDGKVNVSDDLQARIDVANRANSDVLVSVHFNGVADPATRGTFTFWDPDRPHSDRNKALAESVQSSIVKSLGEAGYQTIDRGARTDTSVLGGGHYYLLGPKSEIIARPSNMPAIIGEPLFVTNEQDANALRQDKVIEAVARGYVEGVKAYFAKYPPS